MKTKTVLTVIGRKDGDLAEAPYRNAWIYVDPLTIRTNTLSKFAPGWDCNLQMACRVVGDNLEKYPGAKEGMVGNYYLKKVKLRIIE